MKKVIFGLCLVCSFMAMSCSPNRFFLINSEGILTYNRHTGQLEFMWQTKSAKGDTISIVNCDSLISGKRN